MNSETSHLLVIYQITTTQTPRLQEQIIEVPSTLPPKNITATVKEMIRPGRPADPSDNYKGQSPSDVRIVNLINLSTLL